jgi:serine/threonine-protein kinase
MAPERFFGERATVKSDIYELAVVLFVMLTGGLPWREILDARARLNPLAPSKVGVTVPPGVESALMKALSSDPDERPASVGELAAAIRAEGWAGPTLPAGTPRLERPPGGAGDTDPVRGTPWARAAILVGVVIMVGGLVVALLAGGGGGAGAAASSDAGDAVATAAATPTVQSLAGPPDAGPPDAGPPDAAVVVAAPPRAPAASPPEHRPAPSPPRKPPSAQPAKATAMPWCRKQAALYCTAEFKATEGGMAGELCKRFRAEVTRWEALPAEARASIEAGCEKNYPTFAAAVAERLRQFREHRGPPPASSP